MRQVRILLLATAFFSLSHISETVIYKAHSVSEEYKLHSGEGFTTGANNVYLIDQQKSADQRSGEIAPSYLSPRPLLLKVSLPEENSFGYSLELAGPKPRHVVKSLAVG